MEVKTRVRYADLKPPVRMGERALVIPVNHPNLELNYKWILTTTVQKVIDQARGPVFETRNSIYHPAETDDSVPAYKSAETVK